MEQKKENELTTDEFQSVSGGAGVLKIDDYEERWKGRALKPPYPYQTTAMKGGNDDYFLPYGRPGEPKK